MQCYEVYVAICQPKIVFPSCYTDVIGSHGHPPCYHKYQQLDERISFLT